MKIDFLRASSINTYKDCQWKFFLEQVCGFQSMAGKKATLGTIAHHVLEILAKAKKTGHFKLEDKFTNTDYLCRICFNHYAKSPEGVKNGLKYGDVGADYKFVVQQVLSVMESKYNPLLLNIIDTEKQFEIEINAPGFEHKYINPSNGQEKSGYMKLRGTIDLVVEADADTIQVIDYKTGERKDWITGKEKEIEDFFTDMQLRVYDIATSKIYSQYKYRLFTIIFTRSGGPFTVTFNAAEYQEALTEISKIYRSILENDRPVRIIDQTGRSDGWKCKWVCHFGKTKDENGQSLCDKYHSMYNPQLPTIGTYNLIEEASSLTGGASRRNDYSHDNIFKGKLC